MAGIIDGMPFLAAGRWTLDDAMDDSPWMLMSSIGAPCHTSANPFCQSLFYPASLGKGAASDSGTVVRALFISMDRKL